MTKCNHKFIITHETDYKYKGGYCEFCLREMAFFTEKINKTETLGIDTTQYLRNSLASETDNSKLCKGWDYLKTNLSHALRGILNLQEYWDLKYNSQKVDYIIKTLDLPLNETEKKQLDAFVYVWNEIKRDCEKEETETKLREELTKEGFIEIYNIDIDKNPEKYKEYDNKKVIIVMGFSKIGILGSFDKIERKEGKLVYSDYHKCLMFMPKRHSKIGTIIRDKAYIKLL